MRKLLTFIFFLFLSCISFAQDSVLTNAEEMPYFTGCDIDDLSKKRSCSNKNLIRFISNQLIYPAVAKESGIEGTVYVSFVVDENGKVVKPKIIRDIGGGCGDAAINLLKAMPTWEPGTNKGKAVKVRLNLPIHFSLKNANTDPVAQNYEINWGSLSAYRVNKSDLEAQLDKQLIVRDQFGEEKPIVELIFSFERKRSFTEGNSTGKINEELKKVISKTKKGGVFQITAVIQVKGDLIFVKRSFEIN